MLYACHSDFWGGAIEKREHARLALGRRVRPMRQQQVNHFEVPLVRSRVQRCPVFLQRRMEPSRKCGTARTGGWRGRGAAHCNVAISERRGCGSHRRGSLDIRPARQQQLYHIDVALVRREVQRRSPILRAVTWRAEHTTGLIEAGLRRDEPRAASEELGAIRRQARRQISDRAFSLRARTPRRSLRLGRRPLVAMDWHALSVAIRSAPLSTSSSATSKCP